MGGWLVIWLVFWAESTTKDYIMAKNDVQSVSYLLCTQVVKTQIIHKPQNKSWHKLTKNKTYTTVGGEMEWGREKGEEGDGRERLGENESCKV